VPRAVLTLLPTINARSPREDTHDAERRHVGRGVPVTWALSPRMAERRARMREVGARMFARLGITGVAILDIAREAHVPVSPSAHGYRRRQDLVFDILYAYVDALHEYVGTTDDTHAEDAPRDRLVAAVTALLDGIHEHRDAHEVLRVGFRTLPEDQREALRYSIRTLVYRLAGPLEGVLPALGAARHLQAPLIQSLLGMASHAPFWLRDTGLLSRRDYAGLIAHAVTEAGRAALAERN
jgi:AcrR family transcriptional regulator